ncbi:site-specific integrase [Natrialba phage PhiCh1]|uniref:Integrase family protein n=2 Tax=root TaxID=1 RepID=D3T2I3_NATMM|nr:site-specific integrase [Natrialba magadii]NP_665953.1 site-specific integrase [Natrialba phage PhiCh1]YP_010078064.1 site-specific integrase [Natrialba phage PhiCh1]AAM88709.1 putative site specific recombinase Int1 [Natrialba phage PhiCh1]AAR17459.1 integrase [Natrialba phage PhiCh1]AAR17462.1 integrase [Natrialba phage PhiCh1]AAR17465.1 int1 [Natrialba phage PhiCh1]AAR17468.1 int1 [Natrialba phage PhiCh1]
MSKERHAHEDALNETEFQKLLDGAHLLTPPANLEATFVITMSGKLGMRIGEIAHMKRTWVKPDQGLIEVPSHEPCEKGRDGGLCGYCRRQANRTYQNDPENRDLDELLKSYWEPKTEAAERAVPYEFDEDVEDVVSSFFEYYYEVPLSVNTCRRRVKDAAEASDLNRRVYPHALRATAASTHAYEGLNIASMKAMMGWAKLSTAEKYIRISGGRTKRALLEIYG